MRQRLFLIQVLLIMSIQTLGTTATHGEQDDGIDPSILGFDLDKIPQVIGKPRLVFNGFDDIRGVSFDNRGKLYLADMNRANIYLRHIESDTPDGAISVVFMENDGQISGISFDWNNQMVACQTGSKQLVSINTNNREITVLVDKTPEGDPLNGPNDLVMDSRGGIYFTDPDFRRSEQQAYAQGVYYYAPDRTLTMVTNDLHRPNGIAISPDESTLYVTSSSNALTAYPIIAPDMLGAGFTLVELPAPGDGLTTDMDGNIYVTQPANGKVLILSDKGVVVGSLPTVGIPTDVEFGGRDYDIIFASTRNRLYAFEMTSTGYKAWEPDLPLYLADEKARLQVPWAYGVKFQEQLVEGKLDQAARPLDHPGRVDYARGPGARDGLSLGDLSKEQRIMFDLLLESVLEPRGVDTVNNIRILEGIEGRNGRGDVGTDAYWINLYGTPGSEGVWGWRMEGNNISLNTTYEDGKIASTTPMFLGSQPTMIREGIHISKSPLRSERAGGRSFLMNLDDTQRKRAIVSETAPSGIQTPMGSETWDLEAIGLPAGEMTPQQRKGLLRLVGVFVERAQSDYARSYMKNVVDPAADELIFTWMGSEDTKKPFYYRILGPEFVFEYFDAGKDGDRASAVWRDRVRDYGAHLDTDPADENEDKELQ